MSDFLSQLDRDPSGAHPSGRALELHAFDPEPGDQAVAAHLTDCDQCRAQVSQLRSERQQFLQARPVRPFVARVVAAVPARGGWWTRRWLPASLLTAAVASVIAIVSLAPKENRIGLKGSGLELSLFVSRDRQPAELLGPAEPLGPGEVLRFQVSIPEDGFVFIADLDDQGGFDRFFPSGDSRSAPLRQGRHLLEGSIELDGFVGEERIILLFSKASLEEQEIEAALARAFARSGLRFESLELPAIHTSALIRKARR